MTFSNASDYDSWGYESRGYERGPLKVNALPQRLLGGAALGCIALALGWSLCVNVSIGDKGSGNDAGESQIARSGGSAEANRSLAERLEHARQLGKKILAAKLSAASGNALLANTAGTAAGTAAGTTTAGNTAARFSVSLFDPNFSLGHAPGTFADMMAAETTLADATFAEKFADSDLVMGAMVAANAPDQPQDQVAALTPSPATVRQAKLIQSTPPAGQAATQTAAAPQSRLNHIRDALLHRHTDADRVAADASAAPAEPTFFERLFGKSASSKGTQLAYAAPDDAGLGTSNLGTGNIAGLYDHETAVYDISARTVYLPDGTKLEAHSGLGDMLDDPRFARERNRGVTPPTVYDLTLRESLFHGVQALRLTPKDDAKVFGRSGLLAHTFMLGPNGQSNGCVSFRNYQAFLKAYLNHEIKHLAVVASLN